MSSLALVMCNLWVKTVPTFWKRNFLGVRQVLARTFRLLLEFCWVSSGGKNIVQNLLLWGGLWLNYCYSWIVVIYGGELWLVVSGGNDIITGCGWLLVIGVKLWLVMGGDSEIMTCHGWQQWNYRWSWVVAAKLWLIVGSRWWLWVVARFSNAPFTSFFLWSFFIILIIFN